jgi:acetyl-CoA acyltransferase
LNRRNKKKYERSSYRISRADGCRKSAERTLKNTRPDDLGAAAIREAVNRAEGLDASQIDDVIMGCAFPEAEQGMNVARTAAIEAGLPVEVSAMTVNRYCSSGCRRLRLRRTESARAARKLSSRAGWKRCQ